MTLILLGGEREADILVTVGALGMLWWRSISELWTILVGHSREEPGMAVGEVAFLGDL